MRKGRAGRKPRKRSQERLHRDDKAGQLAGNQMELFYSLFLFND
jgi:hypothetical protein